MNHADLCLFCLYSHAGVLAGAATAVMKFGLRLDSSKRMGDELARTKAELRRSLSTSLGEKLLPIFDQAGTRISMILDDHGRYTETEVNPAGGEQYRNAMFEFIERTPNLIPDYLMATQSLRLWEWAIAKLNMWLLILLSVQMLSIGICIADYLDVIGVEHLILKILFVPTGIVIIALLFFLGVAVNQLRHVTSLRSRYGSL